MLLPDELRGCLGLLAVAHAHEHGRAVGPTGHLHGVFPQVFEEEHEPDAGRPRLPGHRFQGVAAETVGSGDDEGSRSVRHCALAKHMEQPEEHEAIREVLAAAHGVLGRDDRQPGGRHQSAARPPGAATSSFLGVSSSVCARM